MSKVSPLNVAYYDPMGVRQASGYHSAVTRANATSAGLLPLTKNAFTVANHPQTDLIEIVSSDNADLTQTITLVGIDTVGNRITETVTLLGTSVATSTKYFLYFEYAYLSAACVGTLTIREASANATITTITIGDLLSYTSHVFTGQYLFCVSMFAVEYGSTTLAGNITANLLWFPSAASCVALTGSKLIDSLTLFDSEGNLSASRNYSMYPECAPGGYLAVQTIGEGGDDEDVTVILQGMFITV